MNKSIKTLAVCVSMALMTIPAQAQFTSAPAFPGAEGFGRYTVGGRGGQVIHVTRLDDFVDNAEYSPEQKSESSSDYKGTLRYAIKKKGARVVVFDVAGTIELKCPLKISNDSITILGQTAPGDGICLKNYTMSINANNVIVRYIRCRMGDEGKRYFKKEKDGTYTKLEDTSFEDDAMNSFHKADKECHNIIIDHCSLSWCVDECGTFYGNKDFTLQWCILSESLRHSVHVKGNHGYGGIWGGLPATFHHNLIADHDSRNPRFDHYYVNNHTGMVDYINNVVYNWGGNSTYGGETKVGQEPRKFNMINNYYKPGPATQAVAAAKKNNICSRILNPTAECNKCNKSKPGDIVPGQFYLNGNVVEGNSDATKDNYCDAAICIDDSKNTLSHKAVVKMFEHKDAPFTNPAPEFQYATVSTQPAATAYEKVLQYAGASLSRDAVDTRITAETKSGTAQYSGSKGSTGGLIDTPSDVGGWPELKGTAQMDSDKDGIPDVWETAHGLDPKKKNHNTYNLDKKHYYTDLEVYANSLVEDATKAERAGADETFEEYYPAI